MAEVGQSRSRQSNPSLSLDGLRGMARERNGPEIRTASDRIIPDQRLFLLCARYWDRTSDLFRVREARYRCANRACKGCCFVRPKSRVEVATGFEPVYTALQAAASPLGQSTERHNTEKPYRTREARSEDRADSSG